MIFAYLRYAQKVGVVIAQIGTTSEISTQAKIVIFGPYNHNLTSEIGDTYSWAGFLPGAGV